MAGTATQFYTSGPAEVWVGLGASYAFVYLGFTETGLTVEIVPLQEDIQVDYAGLSPGDVAQLGQEANISGTFTRFNEPVSQQLASFFGPNGIAGFGQTDSMGTLMVTEGCAYPLLVVSPYQFKTIYGNMVPGFLFGAAYLVNPHRTVLSVRRKAPELKWRAIPVFGSGSYGSFVPNNPPYNSYSLYTTNLPTALPGGVYPNVT
jgi:hypothetical protein